MKCRWFYDIEIQKCAHSNTLSKWRGEQIFFHWARFPRWVGQILGSEASIFFRRGRRHRVTWTGCTALKPHAKSNLTKYSTIIHNRVVGEFPCHIDGSTVVHLWRHNTRKTYDTYGGVGCSCVSCITGCVYGGWCAAGEVSTLWLTLICFSFN